MKIIAVGSSKEEHDHVSGKTWGFVPYAKGPGKFISAGETHDGAVVGGVGHSVSKGVAQGAGVGIGLALFGAGYSWLKHHFRPRRAR